MNIRKISTGFIFAAALSLSLTACKGGGSSSPASQTTS